MKGKSGQKTRPRSDVAKAKAKSPPAASTKKAESKVLTVGQIALLRRNFSIVEPQSGIAALVFYRNLFALDPSLRSLFHSSIELQGRKLMEALHFTLTSLENPRELVPVLEAMGRRHVGYGTRDEHYATLKQAMLQTLHEILGVEFTLAAETAWNLALEFVIETMIHGARDVQELLRSKPANAPSGNGVRHRREESH